MPNQRTCSEQSLTLLIAMVTLIAGANYVILFNFHTAFPISPSKGVNLSIWELLTFPRAATDDFLVISCVTTTFIVCIGVGITLVCVSFRGFVWGVFSIILSLFTLLIFSLGFFAMLSKFIPHHITIAGVNLKVSAASVVIFYSIYVTIGVCLLACIVQLWWSPRRNQDAVRMQRAYLAAKSESDHYMRELKREEEEIISVPDTEAAEIAEILSQYGIQPHEYSPVVSALRKNPQAWLDFMMKFELGLEKPDPRRALQSAFTIAIAYILGGFVPLVPYMLIPIARKAVVASVVVTIMTLLIFGFAKGYFTGNRPFRSAFETALIGAVASAAAFGLAKAVQG